MFFNFKVTFYNQVGASTSMEENVRDWDENINFINFSLNTMTNQTTGISPFELMFGRNQSIPSALANFLNLTYQDLMKKWKSNHENLLRKAKERAELEMEKTKRRNDESIVKK